MPSVLGIDAAWTLTQPSGLALVTKSAVGWHLVAVESSGCTPNAGSLLTAAETKCGQKPDLVAIDMPLAHSPIVGRRSSDNAVSREYGARKCGTHSPSAVRPGKISDNLRADFAKAGYFLQTKDMTPPGLIEVYPHPALVELTEAKERLPYKASKVALYWPTLRRQERRQRLYGKWADIIAALEKEISGVTESLPGLSADAKRIHVKAYEDKLDAIVCAWVGIQVLEGKARPFGDDQDSAIWIPLPRNRLEEWRKG